MKEQINTPTRTTTQTNSAVCELEQIKEMARVLEFFCDLQDEDSCISECDTCRATALYNAGHRKQSEPFSCGHENGGKWISVEDRLPTECENVLCFEKGKVYVAFLENAEYSAVWWDWVDYDRDDTWTERTPTHWMLLPDPPEMKGGAE